MATYTAEHPDNEYPVHLDNYEDVGYDAELEELLDELDEGEVE